MKSDVSKGEKPDLNAFKFVPEQTSNDDVCFPWVAELNERDRRIQYAREYIRKVLEKARQQSNQQ